MLGQTLGLELSGRIKQFGIWRLYTSFNHRFGAAKPHPSRIVWDTGWQANSRGWSIVLQIYRPGMELDWHTDGTGIHNYVWSVILWQPRKGGRLEVDGPHRRWWRFWSFDGGVSKHRVTRCGSYRIVLMLQRMREFTIEEGMADHKRTKLMKETNRVEQL